MRNVTSCYAENAIKILSLLNNNHVLVVRALGDRDLQEYGYKTKRVRPQGHIFVDIIELPKVD